MIIHMVRHRCPMLATKSIVIKRRNIYDYLQGETALSRMCKPPKQCCRENVCDYPQGEIALSHVSHKARNIQLDRAIYVIIHRVKQRCHVLATKSMVIKRLNSYDYPLSETALSRMCKPPKQYCQETKRL